MSFFQQLRAREPGSAVAYHLEEILEIEGKIRAHLQKLDAVFGVDRDSTAETLVYLQVEIYDHLGYHLKELRKPLGRMISGMFSESGRSKEP